MVMHLVDSGWKIIVLSRVTCFFFSFFFQKINANSSLKLKEKSLQKFLKTS